MRMRSGKVMRKYGCAAVVLAAVFMLPSAVGAKEFSFQYKPGLKYKILSQVEENVYLNGRFSHKADILNRISVEVTDTRDGSGKLEGTFITSERLHGSVSAYQVENTYRSVYWRGEHGNYDIDPSYYMPVVRNVPVFPDEDIEVGDTWEKPGVEVHDLRRGYGIPQPFRIPFRARYRYLGKEEYKGETYDLISVQYTVNHRASNYYSRYRLYPEMVSGYSDQMLYWDSGEGRLHRYREEFSMMFTLSNGDVYRFEGSAEAEVTESLPMDKEKVAEEIEKGIEEGKVKDTQVRVDEKGVTINLEDIRFAPDSARLLPSEKEKLDRIAEILRKYPDRNLQITGHTALAGTRAGRMQLSVERARAVADYLLEKGVRDPQEIIVEGKGAQEPVASNETPEGMRKNRRVEITILEN
jgi:outer membrane protein OmpA-like peptidoglycan-associated protein